MKKPGRTIEKVFNFVNHLVKGEAVPTNKDKRRKPGRSCRIEELENREMLSVNLLDGDGFQSPNDDLNPTDSLIVEITAPAFAPDVAPAPDGYNANDWSKVEAAKANNGLQDQHITWTTIGSEMRLTCIAANSASLVGTLDMSDCTALTYLGCTKNQLTELDVSGCMNLWYVSCYENQLIKLDVTNCTGLEYLDTGHNKLTSLDLSGNRFLKGLGCNYNQITELKLSENIRLDGLECVNNQLKFSTLPSVGIALIYLYNPQSSIATEQNERTVDLSSEYSINGTLTSYTWKYANGTVVSQNLYTNTNGLFVFHGLNAGDTIYCEMTNVKFSKLTLRTTCVTLDCIIADPPTTVPENFQSVAKTTNSVILGWDAVTGATDYEIQYRIDDGAWATADVAIFGTVAIVNNLKSGTEYEFQVRAVNADGESDWSESVLETTDTAKCPSATPPATPENLTSTGKTTDSVTLEWGAVENADCYEIMVNGTVLPGLFAETTAVIEDLESDTPYEFRIRAVNADGESDWSESIFETTDRVLTPPVTPANLESTDKTENSISLAWDAVDNADYYEIMVNGTVLPGTFMDTTAAIESLTPNTSYEFRVRAVNADGESDWSESIFQTTDTVPSTGFRNTDKTVDSVTLAWDTVIGATGYEIRYRTVTEAGSGQWSSENITFTGTTAIISGLEPGTTYEIQMRSRGSGSANSGWSIVEVTTYVAPGIVAASSQISNALATVRGVKLGKKDSKPTHTSFALTWYPAETFNANEITFDVLAPKPKGWAKKNPPPCVASITITAEQLTDMLAGAIFPPLGSGDCSFTFTQKTDSKGNVGIEVKVSGLRAGTKYTIQMQAADDTTGKFSKMTKITVSTATYTAPKSVGKATPGLGKVTFSWKQSTVTPADMDCDAERAYSVGIFVGNEFIIFGSGNGKHSHIINGNIITITVNGKTAVVTGLVSQRYTFGVQESVSVGNDVAKSAVAKISASPMVYKAASIKQVYGTQTLTGTISQTYKNGLPDATYTRGYEYSWYDDAAGSETRKQYIPLPSGDVNIDFNAAGMITGLFEGLRSSKGTADERAVIGVREVIYELDGNVVAKSALTMVNVKW